MPDFSQPVEMGVILTTLGVIFFIIAIGIAGVKLKKRSKGDR